MAAQVICYDEFIVQAMKEAWDHIRTYHCNVDRAALEERVQVGCYNYKTRCLDRVSKASAFCGLEYHVQCYIVQTLREHRDEIMEWLRSGEKDLFYVNGDIPKKYLKGIVFNGHFYDSNKGVVILKRHGKAFRIRTAYPF